MKLTVYLLRDSITEFGQVVPEHHQANGYVRLPLEEELPFPCEAWVQANRPKPPSWVPWLASAFDMEALDLKNQSNSFVLLLKVDGRIFAVTFGYGSNAIPRPSIEPDFGLKVTLNEVDPQALNMLDTRTVDRVSRQRRTHLNVGRSVNEFDISTDMDWIRMVSGRPLSSGFARKLAGSDSLKISMDCAIKDLGKHCRALLKTYKSKTYKKHFGFIDHLRPLKAQDPLLPVLELKLVELLEARDHELVAIAYPEIPDERLSSWRLWKGRKKALYEDLDIERVYDFLDRHPEVPADPNKLQVLGLDEDGNELVSQDRLHRYVVAQVEHEDATYVLSLGHWFRVDKDYVANIRKKVRQLPDVTGILDLPRWQKSMRKEEEYNEHTGSMKEWLVLDRKMIHVEGRDGKVEACDLLSRERDFIHVKDMKDSATLSHLFGQGSVSATLFRSVPAYAEELKARYQAFYGGKVAFDAVKSPPRVVYAIATTKEGELADTLFFFSLVNLLQHIAQVRVAGFDVALCKIERDAA
ncbi:TIGR04141 family sporadically distributed protein [Archangium gephyra]|uniref:DUF6119 family protein n=1 Tax=Archangium gephyra TaxID=48 RepID=UPI0035D488DA